MGSAAPRTWSTSLRCARQLKHRASKHHASQRAAGMPAALFECLMHVAFSHINALSPHRSPTPTSRVALLRLSHAPRPRSSLPCPPRHAPRGSPAEVYKPVFGTRNAIRRSSRKFFSDLPSRQLFSGVVSCGFVTSQDRSTHRSRKTFRLEPRAFPPRLPRQA